MTRWTFGCDAKMEVHVPSGYSYRPIQVRCGSTSHTGGVNQCPACAKRHAVPEPREDEGDMEWYERATGGDE